MAKVFRLPNGITCVTEERPKTGIVTMEVRIKYGSVNESPEENGLTFLMQESCNGGTTTRSREQLAEEIESKGSSMGTESTGTKITFAAGALSRYAGEIFDVMADMVRNPAFDDDEVAKTREQIGQWIASEGQQGPEKKAAKRFSEAAFSGQPITRPPKGTEELMASFTPEQVRRKHAEVLAHPENIVISFAGDIDAAQTEKMVQKYFGDLPAATAEAAKAPDVVFTGGDLREETDNEQLNLFFGFEAPSLHSPDRYAAILLNQYLSGGMSAPLFQEIREKRSLVYSVHASYVPSETNGAFVIEAGTGKGKAGELIPVAMDTLGKIIREGVDQKAIEECRESILGGMRENLETMEGSSERNIVQLLNFGRLSPLEDLEENLKNVTSDDIRRVCADMLKDGKYALSGIGPQETMPSGQKIKDMMLAQVEGVTIPPPHPVKTVLKTRFNAVAKKPPAAVEPKMTVLKNGMKVVTVERPGTLSCIAWVGVGSDNETPELSGASHMNEHMMFKGTKSYGPGEIVRIVEGELGGDLNAMTSKDRTFYRFDGLKARDLERVVDMCGEMVFNADIAHEQFAGGNGAKGERDVVIEEIRRANDNINRQRMNALMATVYPDQAHARPVLGTEETLRAMTAGQLAAYRDDYYVPNNVVFSATGPVSHEDFVALIEKKYGHLPAKDFEPLPTPEYHGGTAVIESAEANMCTMDLVAEAPPSSSPDVLAHEVLALILGGQGLASARLYKGAVMQGQAAAIAVGMADYRNCGMFTITAMLETEKVRTFTDTVYKEIRDLAENLTQAELDKAKILMEAGMLFGGEKNRDVCTFYGMNVMATGDLVTVDKISEEIKNLTVDDVRRAAKNVLQSKPALAAVIPPGTDPGLLPKQEELVAMRDGKKPQEDAAVRPVAARKKGL